MVIVVPVRLDLLTPPLPKYQWDCRRLTLYKYDGKELPVGTTKCPKRGKALAHQCTKIEEVQEVKNGLIVARFVSLARLAGRAHRLAAATLMAQWTKRERVRHSFTR